MCTAVTYKTKNFYFGRNLDLNISYNETVTVTPRQYPFHFRCGSTLEKHYAMIGMAAVAENYPLYYDATNEKGKKKWIRSVDVEKDKDFDVSLLTSYAAYAAGIAASE